MKLKNQTTFHIKGLNQEILLNSLSKSFSLFDIDRKTKLETTFKCSYFDSKKIEKILKSKNVEILKIQHSGLCFYIKKICSCYGLISAVVIFCALYMFQNQYILQYDIQGVSSLEKSDVIVFVKENFSQNKKVITTHDIEVGLMDKFEEISFVSCMIKGQTLVINIKEKLLPDQMYGDFKPIIAQKDAKITKINLVSGTLNVKVGDIVRAGDVLVQPYTLDTSGNIKKVEAKAEIFAEVYNEGSCDHYESFVEVTRTGRVAEKNEVTLFGLNIYTFKQNINFDMYEIEYEYVDMIKNLFLPFKLKKTTYYELQEKTVETKFEDVKDEYVQKAREKALENCTNCDTIIDEFYTLRHLSGMTIVNYCITTLEQIGGYQ